MKDFIFIKPFLFKILDIQSYILHSYIDEIFKKHLKSIFKKYEKDIFKFLFKGLNDGCNYSEIEWKISGAKRNWKLE